MIFGVERSSVAGGPPVSQVASSSSTHPPKLVLEDHGGLRVVLPSVAAPGPTTAVLGFGVGIADEPVASRGICHLIEHVVLTSTIDRFPSVAFNGSVGLTRTTFVARGPKDEVSRFLSWLSRAISEPPTDRLDHERRVLQTEAGARETSLFERSLVMRFGFTGAGRVAVPEWGLEWLPADAVAAWARTWFTAQNAVLWSTAPLPELDVRLPPGEARRPDDAAERAGSRFPSAVVTGHPGTSLSSVVHRTVAASTAVRIAERRLIRRLRHEEGFSYAVRSLYEPISRDRALIFLDADAHPDHVAESAGLFTATISELVEHGPTSAELLEDRRQVVDLMAEDAALPAMLDRAAAGLLFGDDDAVSYDGSAEREALTTEDVQRAAAQLRSSALLMLPVATEPSGSPYPFTAYRDPSATPVAGPTARFRYAPPWDPFAVRASRQGVTMTDEFGRSWTVRFAACAGVVAWRDGSRLLYAADGTALMLDAHEWKHFDRIRRHVDEHAPGPFAELDRDRPRDPDWPRAARRWMVRRAWERTRRGRALAAAVGTILALVIAVIITLVVVSSHTDVSLAAPLSGLVVAVIFAMRDQKRGEQ